MSGSSSEGDRQEDEPMEYDEIPVGEMEVDALREQYKKLSEELYYGYAPHIHDWHEDAHDRMMSVWNELRSRVDVNRPECPECGARDWGQSPGDPKRCGDCGFEVFGEDDEELRKEIDDAWSVILDGEQDE